MRGEPNLSAQAQEGHCAPGGIGTLSPRSQTREASCCLGEVWRRARAGVSPGRYVSSLPPHGGCANGMLIGALWVAGDRGKCIWRKRCAWTPPCLQRSGTGAGVSREPVLRMTAARLSCAPCVPSLESSVPVAALPSGL